MLHHQVQIVTSLKVGLVKSEGGMNDIYFFGVPLSLMGMVTTSTAVRVVDEDQTDTDGADKERQEDV